MAKRKLVTAGKYTPARLTDNEEFALLELEEKLKEKFSEVEFIVIPTSGICSFYGEEGGMLLGYEI